MENNIQKIYLEYKEKKISPREAVERYKRATASRTNTADPDREVTFDEGDLIEDELDEDML